MRIPWRYLPPLLLTLLLLSTGSTACSLVSPSDAPLPETTMTKALVGLHLANARQNVDSLPSGFKDSVLNHHGIERSSFESTLRHYSRNPEALDALYDTVLDTLNALESALQQDRYDALRKQRRRSLERSRPPDRPD